MTETTAVSQKTSSSANFGRRVDPVVPMWVAVVVLALLFAAVGAGGFFLRGLVERPRPTAQETVDKEVEKWSKEVARQPESAAARLGLAYAFQQNRQLDRALQQYAAVLRLDPANSGALYQQGQIYLDLGLDKDAEASLWKVLEFEPTHVQAAETLGRHYADQQLYLSVITAVSPAAVAHPDVANLQYLLGLAYENLGNPEGAIEQYGLALAAAPDHFEAHEGLKRLGAR